ncbi:sulfotransferase family protein [Flexithrix dorotheae]|uniref:sulfotransferase family protein n=1 Tax=Flexithrix dorotheae TaxID=70993 RepID=UPI0003825528|nr:sulfotransferase [Flexithrix dorotheae]
MDNQKTSFSHWKAPNDALLPEFIIGGAMKCGTTTLHAMLAKHPKIFIPEEEIHFFDIDHHIQHADFNFYDKKKDQWTVQLMEQNPEKLWDWYLKKFAGKEQYVKGEDSTIYLASRIAAERIALQNKEIKLIFLLRHPTKRAYSQYYHMLRTGRATHTFEDTLKYNPVSVLERSLYRDQLEPYYKHISKERIKIVLFEDFIQNTAETLKEICEFIEVDFDAFDPEVFQLHTNQALIPSSFRLQRFFNRIFKALGTVQYFDMLPFAPSHIGEQKSFFMKYLKKTLGVLNPHKPGKPPKIKDSTKNFLDQYFYNQLVGIDELTGEKILSKWFPERN